MVVPVEQTCPECRRRFKGSDIVGYPCPECQGIDGVALKRAVAALDYYEGKSNDRPRSN